MTVKCCRDCLYAKTNSVFPNQAECDIWHTEVPPRPAKSTLDTFYCGAFTRRNSANVSVEQTIQETQEEEKYERVGTWPYVKRKVPPPRE